MVCGALCGVTASTGIGVLAVDTLAGSVRFTGLLPTFFLFAMIAAAGSLLALWTAARGIPPTWYLLPVVGSVAWTTVVTHPAIVAWAGPALIIPFVLLAIGIVLSTRVRIDDSRRQRLRARFADGPWSPLVAATATALGLAVMLAAASSFPVTGDEPHYLLVTQSLLDDGDIDLRNNYDAETYRSFYFGPLQRHVTLGYLAQEYSFHGLGLSFLLLPGYALGGVVGSRLFVLLLTALGAGFFWSTARRVTSSAAAAWAGWLAMTSAATFAVHGILMYPDGVGAAITCFALWVLASVLVGERVSVLAVVGCGIALAALPWLHIRLSLTAAVFGLALVLALGRKQRDLILPFLAAPLIGFVLWIANTWVMFHTLDPTAAFRERAAGSVGQVPIGTLGLLFDVEYGLLTYAPALMFSVLGVGALWKRSRVLVIVSVTLTLATLWLGAAWVWWGGDSAPARFLAPVVPLIALCVAAWWPQASVRARAFAAVTMVFGAIVTACLAAVDGGVYMSNVADGGGTVWQWLSPHVDVGLALPSLFRAGAVPANEAVVAASWIAVSAAALAWSTYRRSPGDDSIGTSWRRASVATMIWLTAGAGVGWLQREGSPWSPDRAQLRMLYAATSPLLTVGLRGAGWEDGDGDTLMPIATRESALSSIAIRTPGATSTQVRLHVPFVPAGRYAIEADRLPASPDEPPLRLSLTLGRNAMPAAAWFVTSSATPPTFSLAVPVWSVHVQADTAADAPADVRLRPLQVVAPPPRQDYALSATVGGPLLVYGLDAYSSPAAGGYQIPPNRLASFIVTDDRGSPVPFMVHAETSAPGVTVTVQHGTFEHTAPLVPEQLARFLVPAQAAPLLPVRITVTRTDDAPGAPSVSPRVDRRVGAVVTFAQ